MNARWRMNQLLNASFFCFVLLLLHTLENTSSDDKEVITKLSVVEKLLDALQKAKENKVMISVVLNFTSNGPVIGW